MLFLAGWRLFSPYGISKGKIHHIAIKLRCALPLQASSFRSIRLQENHLGDSAGMASEGSSG